VAGLVALIISNVRYDVIFAACPSFVISTCLSPAIVCPHCKSGCICLTYQIWLVDPEDLIERSRDHPARKHIANPRALHSYGSSYARDEENARIPKYTMPKEGINSKVAYQLIHDEMALDGNPTLNLAS
jgi:hypothetical protein